MRGGPSTPSQVCGEHAADRAGARVPFAASARPKLKHSAFAYVMSALFGANVWLAAKGFAVNAGAAAFMLMMVLTAIAERR